ncbi:MULTISPECIES: T9SS type A sorting domain-containing protein [Bizionia]|uniref:T9SS type A sorting domain-containing protein n=1 Tax=Bizionia algoritergicola TaxID=291187 RepID=A0A5D0QZU4_9FLAO|nr:MULTISPECIES: T9SS type A sorting domain-containing protein [Bizionia]OBX23131.1 hypothetical protein BAA08_06250 [Bizionia sp. APA-3]TYB74793.1 T9SS type A sorting domain-containing protein [Bizionia algoritergicola]
MKKNDIFKNAISKGMLLCCIMLLVSYSATAQNLIFTIDTVIDDAADVMTETITQGADSYVLLINHPGLETLDDVGGGDLIVYIGSGGPVLDQPYVISLTKNNDPFSFTLNSLDYDTLGVGDISLENQDDFEISPNTEYPVGFGTITPSNMTNATNIANFKITPHDDDGSGELNDFGFHNFNITVGTTLGTNSFELSEKIHVYPNPSNGNITIRNSGVALEKVNITDLHGRVVSSYNLYGITTDKKLDLRSELASGMYFMSITSEKGVLTKKILIK